MNKEVRSIAGTYPVALPPGAPPRVGKSTSLFILGASFFPLELATGCEEAADIAACRCAGGTYLPVPFGATGTVSFTTSGCEIGWDGSKKNKNKKISPTDPQVYGIPGAICNTILLRLLAEFEMGGTKEKPGTLKML